MIKMFSERKRLALMGGLIAVLLTLPGFAAQNATGQDPAKAYEKYLGKYEFDLSALGGGIRIFEFYVKDGGFWIEYGFTSPGELKAVPNTVDEFTFDEPDDGLIKITFQKDAEGKYSKCRFVVDSQGLDIVGEKKKV